MPHHIPEGTACDDQQNDAQQGDQNVLASFSSPVEGGRIRKHAVDPDRIRDVLYLAISERLISANQFVLHLLVNAARDVNLARLGNALEARSNIDAIAVNVGCFDDDVAKIDANPILDPMMPGQRCVASNHVLLNDDATSHGFDGTVENRNKAVACGFDDPATMERNGGIDQIAAKLTQALERALFVNTGQPRIAYHIGG